jgi:hypothetical protein
MPMRTKGRDYSGQVLCFLKVGLRRADTNHNGSAERLAMDGLEEAEVGIASKLAGGTFLATFLPACLAFLGLTGVGLKEV